MPKQYGNGNGNNPSSIGEQLSDFQYQRNALIEARKQTVFMPMASTIGMPKNMGKRIKRDHYIPILDDANINDQGIDATGASVTQKLTIRVTNTEDGVIDTQRSTGFAELLFVGEGANAAAALLAAQTAFNTFCETATALGGLGLTLVGGTEALKYVDAVNNVDGLAYALGYRVAGDLVADAVPQTGNLYGSSKDIGAIQGKLPALTENGGTVNRVGMKRVTIEGTFQKFGFYESYTKESVDFDSDPDLRKHVNREMLNAAHEMTEAALQIDILNAAGVVRYGGDATNVGSITGEGGTPSLISYEDFMRLSITLDNNRTPKETKMITGSKQTDTRTIDGARYMFIGSELVPSIRRMVDLFNNQAFIPVHKYAAAGGNIMKGEIGSVDQFRIVVVPEMLHWAGVGATETGANPGYRASNGKYDVFPMLVIGNESFTTIGFQTNGKVVKFKIKHVKPESEQSYSLESDPFGEKGFMSIKWYYGFMKLRAERLAVLKSVAEL